MGRWLSFTQLVFRAGRVSRAVVCDLAVCYMYV